LGSYKTTVEVPKSGALTQDFDVPEAEVEPPDPDEMKHVDDGDYGGKR
jgi:hypothetical protein